MQNCKEGSGIGREVGGNEVTSQGISFPAIEKPPTYMSFNTLNRLEKGAKKKKEDSPTAWESFGETMGVGQESEPVLGGGKSPQPSNRFHAEGL